MVAPHKRTIALIVAAGTSQRLGEGMPKQYRSLGGKTVLRRTVEAFLAHQAVDDVCVVIHPDHETWYKQAVDGLKLPPPVQGGATRQQSVKSGLKSLEAYAPQHVLVHDAARCFIDAATISRVIDALQSGAQAVIPALPVADTLKKVHDSVVETTISRDNIYLIQTPQGFDFEPLKDIHVNNDSKSFTDDAALAESAGVAVQCVAGSSNNFKITTTEDWQRAEMMIRQSYTTRTGMGYDVHRLIPREGSRQLMLCGVAIPHDFVLEGHSDADVGLHALTDAILGALTLGDIGSHFPPSDPQWKGADSAQFIAYCVEQLHAREALLTHVDITLICEAPKISPHRTAMQQRVAALLGIDPDCVSIKATTSEGLGFTGRREGIASQAIATIHLPKKGAL